LRELCIENWTRRLDAERLQVPSADRESFVPEFKELRRRFGELTQRSQVLLADPRLKHSELAVLHRLALEGLTVSKLIYAELEQEETSSEAIVPPALVEELMEWNEEQLDRLETQLRLLDSTDCYADDLHDAIEELQHLKKGTPARFRNLARRIILDARDSSRLDLLMPEPGLSLRDYLSRRSRLKVPAVYAGGIQTARLLAWTAGHSPRWSDRLELLTVAALLHDCGFLSLASRQRCMPERLAVTEPPAYRKHPAIGAALVAGIRDYSIDLPFLIAQHHERLDGTGFPDRLHSGRLSQASRLLAIVSRFVELRQNSTTAGDQTPTMPRLGSASCPAVTQLYREAEQGEWDLALTVELLKCLDSMPPTARDAAAKSRRPLALDALGAKVPKRDVSDDVEQAVPSPIYWRRRRGRRNHPLSRGSR